MDWTKRLLFSREVVVTVCQTPRIGLDLGTIYGAELIFVTFYHRLWINNSNIDSSICMSIEGCTYFGCGLGFLRDWLMYLGKEKLY